MALFLILALWLGWMWRSLREEALVGASYAARVGCVCRFVSERTIDMCDGDLKVAGLTGAARWVSLTEDADRRAVRASVPLLAEQSADFDPHRGCQLQPWPN